MNICLTDKHSTTQVCIQSASKIEIKIISKSLCIHLKHHFSLIYLEKDLCFLVQVRSLDKKDHSNIIVHYYFYKFPNLSSLIVSSSVNETRT